MDPLSQDDYLPSHSRRREYYRCLNLRRQMGGLPFRCQLFFSQSLRSRTTDRRIYDSTFHIHRRVSITHMSSANILYHFSTIRTSRLPKMLKFLLAVLVAIFGQFVLPYDLSAYYEQKRGLRAVYDQQYSSNTSAVYPLYKTYRFCGGECPRIGSKLPDPKSLRQWVEPLVQFILPAIIFSFSVPRRKKIEFEHIFDFSRIDRLSTNGRYQWFNSLIRLAVSLMMSTIILIPIIIDTILWIAVILVCAGNMLVAGLYEINLDYRIAQRVQGTKISVDDRTKRLLTVVSGSLIIDPKLNLQGQKS